MPEIRADFFFGSLPRSRSSDVHDLRQARLKVVQFAGMRLQNREASRWLRPRSLTNFDRRLY